MSAIDVDQLKVDLKEAFDKADTNHDGKISRPELKAALQQAGFEGTDENVQDIMSRVDTSGDGLIDFHEFSVAVVSIGIAVRITMVLRRVFVAMDLDGSGYIEPREIRALIDQSGVSNVSDADIDQIVKEVDTSGDGRISFEEFAASIGKQIQESMSK